MLKYPKIDERRGRKSPSGRTLWCGPFAVAMVTGLEYDEAYKKVLADIRRAIMKTRREYAKKRGVPVSRSGLPTSVQGTYEHQIVRILNKLRVTTKLVYTGPMSKRPTLLTFVRDHTVKGRTYIIVAGNHWVTVKDGVLYHSHHDPLPVEDAPRYKMARVECWAEVKPRPEAIKEEA